MRSRPEPSLATVSAELTAVAIEATDVSRIGAGHWSTAYGFTRDTDELVVRFGRHISDFGKDSYAARFDCEALPIPAVHHLSRCEFDSEVWLIVSDRAPGEPLEDIAPDHWTSLIPDLVELFERLRWADVPGTGWGGFNADGVANDSSWGGHLTSEDGYERRPADWYDRICRHDELQCAYDVATERLAAIDLSDATRSLVHGDLINRNVHVHGARISGVFDWGCARFGDHLYDLAWLQFWAPWHPNLDVEAFADALRRRWHDDGTIPRSRDERLRAALLHIGVDHIVYGTTIGNPDGARDVVDRMAALNLV